MNDYIFLRNFMTIKNIFMSAMCSACIMISNQCIAKTDLENLPSYETWLEHASYLEKFWLHKDARGVPEGNFPTWRCNDGTLRNHLVETDIQRKDRIDTLINELKQQENVSEDLKNTNPLAWVGAMNNIKNRAEEIVFNELIYI